MAVRFANPAFERDDRARRRLKLLYAGIILGYLAIAARGVVLMLQDNHKLEKIAMKQYRAAIQQASDRNRILDAKGQELAISVPAWSLYADPKEIKSPLAVASGLAKVLELSRETLHDKLKEKRRFVWIKRRLDAATMEKINRLNLDGVYSIKENMRAYPHGELAGSILGSVGVDSQPLGGMELAYNDYLLIRPQSGIYLKDARGQVYVTSNPDNPPEASATAGDVWLTLDKNLQFFAEEALKPAVREYDAKGGMAIVMDAVTGGILALANEPSFHPGRLDASHPAAWRNRAVTDVYEPGSTFKVITAAAALENNVISMDEKIFCENGALPVTGNHVINDHERYGNLNLAGIIKVSSNIGIYKVQQRLGKRKFHDTIRAFGFGSRTGIDYPGEVGGLVRPVEKWKPIESGTISFGQGIGVTALQIVSAFAAIANNGVRMQPYLVERVVSKNGEVLFQNQPTRVAQAVSPQTAALLTRILRGVVEKGGTAMAAAIDEYPVAGKTGTAQKVEPGSGVYARGKYIASFVGYAPADNPRLAVLVLLDEPQGFYYGGVVAAPVFREILLKSLHYLGVPPRGAEKNILLVKSTLPQPPKSDVETTMTQEGNLFKVPDFRGVSLRQVLKAAGHFPVSMEFRGRGSAVSQRPEAGEWVTAGSRIYVEFRPLY